MNLYMCPTRGQPRVKGPCGLWVAVNQTWGQVPPPIISPVPRVGTVVEHGRLEGVRQGSARVLGGFGKKAPRPSGRVGFCPPGGRSGAEITRGSCGKGLGDCLQVEEGGWAGG